MVAKEPCKKTSIFAVSLMILYVPSYLHTHHMHVGTWGVQKRVLGPQELKLWVTGSHH